MGPASLNEIMSDQHWIIYPLSLDSQGRSPLFLTKEIFSPDTLAAGLLDHIHHSSLNGGLVSIEHTRVHVPLSRRDFKGEQ